MPKPGGGGLPWMFVELATDAGITGTSYSEGAGPVRSMIHDQLSDLVVGADPFETEKLWTSMFWRTRGNGRKGVAFQAISAIDNALWDIKAKALRVPLYRLLGPAHDHVEVYGSGGWTHYTEKELVREQASFVERGFPRTKMKVARDFGRAEKEDIARLAAVRKALGDDVTIYVDANNGYYAKQAIRMARRFEQYNVGWFEEPVLADDIEGLAQIARSIDIPVATGEHEYTKYGFKELISRGGADIVQPDVGRVGGITEWMKVAHLAHAFNLPVAPHAVQLVHLHMAMCTPNLKVVEYLSTTEEGDRVWYTEFPEPKDGMWAPYPDRPGLGLELSPAAVREYAV
jgi:L-alanine-DL-glutamate epimerase-like enolase superfamily enzyme